MATQSHLLRRIRTASRHRPWSSATHWTLCPAASNRIVSARCRSRQSAPFLMIALRQSRSLSANSIRATRATAPSSFHVSQCRVYGKATCRDALMPRVILLG